MRSDFKISILWVQNKVTEIPTEGTNADRESVSKDNKEIEMVDTIKAKQLPMKASYNRLRATVAYNNQ